MLQTLRLSTRHSGPHVLHCRPQLLSPSSHNRYCHEIWTMLFTIGLKDTFFLSGAHIQLLAYMCRLLAAMSLDWAITLFSLQVKGCGLPPNPFLPPQDTPSTTTTTSSPQDKRVVQNASTVEESINTTIDCFAHL